MSEFPIECQPSFYAELLIKQIREIIALRDRFSESHVDRIDGWKAYLELVLEYSQLIPQLPTNLLVVGVSKTKADDAESLLAPFNEAMKVEEMSKKYKGSQAAQSCESILHEMLSAFDNLTYLLNAVGHLAYVEGSRDRSVEAINAAVTWSLCRAKFQRLQEMLAGLPVTSEEVAVPELPARQGSFPHELMPLFEIFQKAGLKLSPGTVENSFRDLTGSALSSLDFDRVSFPEPARVEWRTGNALSPSASSRVTKEEERIVSTSESSESVIEQVVVLGDFESAPREDEPARELGPEDLGVTANQSMDVAAEAAEIEEPMAFTGQRDLSLANGDTQFDPNPIDIIQDFYPGERESGHDAVVIETTSNTAGVAEEAVKPTRAIEHPEYAYAVQVAEELGVTLGWNFMRILLDLEGNLVAQVNDGWSHWQNGEWILCGEPVLPGNGRLHEE